MIDVDAAVRRLIEARSGPRLALGEVEPADLDEVYALQEATVAALGGCAGWKVGATSPTAPATFAPLPRVGIRSAGEPWVAGAGPVAVEVEIAFRVARAIDAALADRLDEPAARDEAFDAVMVAVEIVETRLADWTFASLLAKAGDLLSHGALILGAPRPLGALAIDPASATVRLDIDGSAAIATTAGNPAGDPLRLLRPLARHCVDRRHPLQPGQIVTTGSFTGMTEVAPPVGFTATIDHFGALRGRIAAPRARPAIEPDPSMPGGAPTTERPI